MKTFRQLGISFPITSTLLNLLDTLQHVFQKKKSNKMKTKQNQIEAKIFTEPVKETNMKPEGRMK